MAHDVCLRQSNESLCPILSKEQRNGVRRLRTPLPSSAGLIIAALMAKLFDLLGNLLRPRRHGTKTRLDLLIVINIRGL
jgi:hypothetical protein